MTARRISGPGREGSVLAGRDDGSACDRGGEDADGGASRARRAVPRWLAGQTVAVVGLARSGVAAARLIRRLGGHVLALRRQVRSTRSRRTPALAAQGCALWAGGHPAAAFAGAGLVVLSPGVPFDLPALAGGTHAGSTRRGRARAGLASHGGGRAGDHRHQRQDHDHRPRRRVAARSAPSGAGGRATSALRWPARPRRPAGRAGGAAKPRASSSRRPTGSARECRRCSTSRPITWIATARSTLRRRQGAHPAQPDRERLRGPQRRRRRHRAPSPRAPRPRVVWFSRHANRTRGVFIAMAGSRPSSTGTWSRSARWSTSSCAALTTWRTCSPPPPAPCGRPSPGGDPATVSPASAECPPHRVRPRAGGRQLLQRLQGHQRRLHGQGPPKLHRAHRPHRRGKGKGQDSRPAGGGGPRPSRSRGGHRPGPRPDPPRPSPPPGSRRRSAYSMDEAVARAASRARPGDVVLLSPACASFDMFHNFEHRGDVFKAAVIGSDSNRR